MNAQTKKSGTDKMSQSGKVVKIALPKRAIVLRLVALFCLILFVLSALVTAYVWQNRTNLAESQIRKFMIKDGYDIALDVRTLSKKRAVITDVAVSKNNEVFFKSARMVVDYDLAKRQVLRIQLEKPSLKVEFDTKGNITSSWMKPSTGQAQKLALPPNGVVIQDASIDWRLMLDTDTLLGTGQAEVSADIISDINWNANIAGTQAVFNTHILKGDIGHDVYIETKDGKSFDVFGSVSVENLSTDLLPLKDFRARTVNSQFKFNFVRAKDNERPTLFGWSETHINELSTQDYSAQGIDLKLAQVRLPANGQISTNWQMETNGARIRNGEIRANLANALTAHSAMANIPIAQYFTKTLYNKAERLLNGFAMGGQGSFVASGAGYTVHLERPLDLKADGQMLRFTQISDGFVQYDQPGGRINFKADIKWSGRQALKLSSFTLDATSGNGIKLEALTSMSAHIRSRQDWRMHQGGSDIRLAPFDLGFSYTDQGNADRTIKLSGAIDYDGPVPGGYVLGLETKGDMQVQFSGGGFSLGYTPSGPLYIGEFTNPSGWTTKSLNFTLKPQANLLRRTAKSGIMHTALKDVHTQIVGPEGKRHLDARFEHLDVTTDFAKSPQRWHVNVSGTDIKSEDFPAPGTHILSPFAELDVTQTRDGKMSFNILSPKTRVVTNNALIENLHINLNGSPDDIALTYQAGSVEMVGGTIPVLPMHGTARLKSGELTGHAITNLPRTKDTPIDIHYRSQDGQGSAEIIIPKIAFDPRGLQPQHLVPLLRGKLADVSGEISAEFNFIFGGGRPVQSSGWADLKGLDFSTLVGPLSGVTSHLSFASIFPLKTQGVQTATLNSFDPGFPLNNGILQFEAFPGGVKVHQAVWPIENIEGTPGEIYLTPTDWNFGNVENLVTINVENVGLGTMLASVGKDKFSATGQIYGTLPAKVKGVDVLIEGGLLTIKDGGLIRYKTGVTDAATAENENARHAFKALENFQYKQLEARIDGPIDGTMALKIVFDGQNPEVLGGQPFQFNTTIKGELANIARNMAGAFSNEENLTRILEIQKAGQTEQP